MSDDTQRVIGQIQAEIRQLREALREAELARKMADLEGLLNQVMGADRCRAGDDHRADRRALAAVATVTAVT